ncbi:mucin-binding protein [Pediococcus damnosus]|uniref:mucin-binding protein n=2 Tax=Pediococcus damnosus TaxID=51663 RepID=UPI0031D0CD5D
MEDKGNQKKFMKLVHDEGDTKEHYKMYKAGRIWVFAGISLLTFGAATFGTNIKTNTSSFVSSENVAKAATVDSSSTSDSNGNSNSVVLKSSAPSSNTTSTSEVSSAATTVTYDTKSASVDKVGSSSASDSSSSGTSSESSAAASSSTSSLSDSTSTESSGNKTNSASSEKTESSSSAAESGTSAASSVTTTNSASSTESAVSVSSAVATSAESATSSDSSENSNSSTDSNSSIIPNAATAATAKALQDQLGEGSTVTVNADGSTTIVLAPDEDASRAQALASEAGLTNVTIEAKAAALTGPLTYDDGISTSSSDYSGSKTRLDVAWGSPITMADIALMTAAGTGAFVDGNGNSITNATRAQLIDYYNYLKTTATLKFDFGTTDAGYAAAFDDMAAMYYYSIAAPDSYLNSLNTYLGTLTANPDDLTKALQMATDANTDSDISQAYKILESAGEFLVNDYMFAGTGENDIAKPVAPVKRWNEPEGLTDSSTWTNVQKFINGTLSLYISEIVPGAQKYVFQTVLPAVNSISDVQGIDVNEGQDKLLSDINTQSIALAYKLMSVDGEYSLTTMVPHIEEMYSTANTLHLPTSGVDFLTAAANATINGLVSNMLGTGSLGEYVGALESGTGTGWNSLTLSGDGVAYPIFSIFNSIYLSYSRVLITADYGYMMVGKYDAMKAMYDGTLPTDITETTAASGINTTKTHTGTAIPTGIATTTYQQGYWDTYHYILPFYKAKLNDMGSNTAIVRSSYPDGTAGDKAYEDAVWARVTGDSTVNGNTDTKNPGILGFDYATDTASANTISLATTADPNDSNPHNNADSVSAQTEAYLVQFYSETVGENAVSYQLQPVVRTTITSDGTSSGTVYGTTDTPLGDPTAALTGAPGAAADTSTLPLTAKDTDGTTYDKPSTLNIDITENGGTINVPYGTKTVRAGATFVHATGEPANTTFNYTVYNSDKSVFSSGTDEYSTAEAGTEFDLTEGQYITVTPAAVANYTVAPATAQTISFDDTVTGTNSMTFAYVPTDVTYNIQPVYQSGTDANGKPVYVNLGKPISDLSGVPGAAIDATKLTDIAGYSKPTYNDTDEDKTNDTPTIPTTTDGTVNAVYTVNAEQVKVTETGVPANTTFTYTVNGGTPVAAAYTDGAMTIDANYGDVVVITPETVGGYNLTGTDEGVATKTITVGENTINADKTVTISKNNTAAFVYTIAEATVGVNFVDSDGKAITQTYLSGFKEGINQYDVVYGNYTNPTVTVAMNSDDTVDTADVISALSADTSFKLPQKYVYTWALGGLAMNYRIAANQTATVVKGTNGNYTITVKLDTPIAVQLAVRGHNGTNKYGDMGTVTYDSDNITNDADANALSVSQNWITGDDGNQAFIGYVGDTYDLTGTTFTSDGLAGRWDTSTITSGKLKGTLTSAMDYYQTQATNADGTPATTTDANGTTWQTMKTPGNTQNLIADEAVKYDLYGNLPDGTKTQLNSETGIYGDAFDKAGFISSAVAKYTAITSSNGREMTLDDDATMAVTNATTALTDIYTYDKSTNTPGTNETGSSYTPNTREFDVAYDYVPASITVNYYTEDSTGKATLTKTDTIDSDYVKNLDSSIDGFYVGDSFSKYVETTPDGYAIDATKSTLPTVAADRVATDANNTSSYNVYYTPNSENLDVTYVDDDNSGAIVATDNISGLMNGTGTYVTSTSGKVPAGYQLAKNQSGSVAYTFTADDTDNLTIHLIHSDSKPITPTDPTDPNYRSTHKTISRKIAYMGVDVDSLTTQQKAGLSDEQLADLTAGYVTQTGNYTRTVTTDEITGKAVSYGDWTLATNEDSDDTDDGFTAVTSPVVPGYTADTETVAADPLDTTAVDGFEAGSADKTVTYTAGKTTTVTPSNPKNPTDPVDPSNPSGPKYPSGVSETDLNKTVTRKITYTGVNVNDLTAQQKAALSPEQLADLTAGYVTQTGTYTRNATVDSTTGKLVGYTPWTLTDNTGDTNDTNDGFTAVTSPVVPGYTADKASVGAITLNDADVTGFQANSDDTTVNYTAGKTTTVTPSNPKNPTDPVDPSNPSGPKYPSGVSETDLNKTVTRKITYTGAGKQTPPSVTENGYYTRTATIDSNTGALVGYGKWTLTDNSQDDDETNDGFMAVISPNLKGFTVNPNVVPEIDLTNDEVENFKSEPNIVVTYVPNNKIVDNNGSDVNPQGEVTVTRVIHFEGAGKKTPGDILQKVVYKLITNESTGETSWTPQGVYNEVDVPEINGYTPSDKEVAELIPNAIILKKGETLDDLTVTIAYTPINSGSGITTPSNPNGTGNNTTGNGQTGKTNDNGNTKNSNNVKKENNNVIGKTGNKGKTNSSSNKNVNTGTLEAKTAGSSVNGSNNDSNNSSSTSQGKLPQTNENSDKTEAAVGLSLMGMILSWFGLKRKKRDDD